MLSVLKPILFASLSTMITVNAQAMTSAAIAPQELVNILHDEIQKCPTLDCASSRVQLGSMSAHDFTALPKEIRATIRDKMTELARDFWPDTILEGPFHVKFNIRLERSDIKLLIVDNQFVGYRIGYSDKAWDMDRCQPMTSPSSKQDLDDCESGRIYDRGFVSSDFSFAFRDESSFSAFKQGE